jgi:ketosteroid isomerase-like protein
MTNEKNVQAIQQAYVDFGNKNVEGLLNNMTDDVVWNNGNNPEIPYDKIRNGKKETMEFFMETASMMSYTEFAPKEFFADNDAVIVKGAYAGKITATGKLFASEWVHIFKFRGDKVCHFQAFKDTAVIIAAFTA